VHSAEIRELLQNTFPEVPGQDVDELVAIGQVRSYAPHQRLCTEGAIEFTFYIILDGQVQVQKTINESEARFLKPLGVGDFFGEYALIHDAPRTASVVTTVPTEVLEIHKDQFNILLRRSATVAISMMREVSRRLRENDEMALEDLRLKAAELAQAYQKLAELDFARREFLTTAAHELRTPLTSANGYLHVVRHGMVPSDQMPNVLDRVAENVLRITAVVNDILFLQEMDLILQDPAPTPLIALLNKAIAANTRLARDNGIEFVLDAPKREVETKGDSDSLERALTALVENAVKFSPDGGKVWARLVPNGKDIKIVVADQGVGIPPDSLPFIFERFYHIDRIGDHVFGGMGLGLAIAQQVIRQHGGDVSVESEFGAGSQFTVALPIHH
jgi:signal transduction histidine kinase